MFGNPKPPGGRALKFSRRCVWISAYRGHQGWRPLSETEPRSSREETQWRPLPRSEFDIIYGEGVSGKATDRFGVAQNLVEKRVRGSATKRTHWQGRENARQF